MFSRLRDEEHGVAMIMALAVSFIVLLLSTVVIAQSIHSLESSGYDRERLLSVNAAEAGTNYWYAFLETTPPGTMATNGGVQRRDGQRSRSATWCSRDRRRPPSRPSARSTRPTEPR